MPKSAKSSARGKSASESKDLKLKSSKLGKFKGSVRMLSLYHRLKNKKRDGTPEKSATPSQDTTDENRPPSPNVIWNEEIEKLQIKSEEILKLHEPKPPAERKKTPVSQKISVRKLKPASEWDKPKPFNITVARPASEDAPLKPINYSGYGGPQYNSKGDVLSHSLLGSFDDFHNEAVKRGDFINVETPRVDVDQSDKPTLKYQKVKQSNIRKTADENNALINWQLKMIERKKQQGYISNLLQVNPEDLTMNQADNYRKMQEKRELIDKTIPAVDYGKGYRVGSEFWNQQKLLGDEVGGVHMTLNQTECGNYPPLEHVGIPQTIRQEKDLTSRWTWGEYHRNEVHYPWHKTPYLSARQKQLQHLINEIDPHQPNFDGLEIIGTNRPVQKSQDIESHSGLTEIETEEEETYVDPLRDHPDVYPAPIFGPSLEFAGQPARWTGDSHSFQDQIGIEARVTFEAYTNVRVTSYLEIVNNGTTSIYFDWKKLPTENRFELVKSYIQRFYFNNSSGVILPGETMKFPFVFKSENAGVFTEQWRLETRPVVCGGAALIVTLRGVALQEDTYKIHRETIEQHLSDKQANQVVNQLLYELIDGIRTPERSRSPIDAYITEEETFKRLNHGMCYRHEQVEELKRIYLQLFTLDKRDDQSWDLSIDNLKQKILELPEDDELKEPMLQQVNLAVQKISFLPTLPVIQEMEKVAYEQISEAIDNICGYSIYLRNAVGLPEKDFEESLEGDSTKPEQTENIEIKKKGGRKTAAKSSNAELDLPLSESKRSRASDKSKSEPKQEKKTPSANVQKGSKSAKEQTPKPPPTDSKGKITPAPKKPPSRMGTITPGPDRERTEISANNSPTPTPEPNSDSILDRKYKEKLYSMSYLILADMARNVENLFEDIKQDTALKP
ncbi:MYCBP-associated protein isoform X4 [Patella vulgata]|uniref:MYCBP-associated protein isoform X4 n=1 Tax=Patella vulgata TaxID=6465 RepID=UPI0024A9C005|nr:MYCBP-associated protein isoform X4 [Patella vulgata]